MRNALLMLAAILAAGMISLGLSAAVTAQGTPPAGTPTTMGGDHPAHIHNGTCAALGDVVAPLGNINAMGTNDGTPMAMDMVGSANAIPVLSSITTVDLPMADILAADHALNVHESAEDIGTYVACGDIGGAMLGEADILFGLAPMNNSGLSGVASLHDNGDGTTTVYVYLTQAGGGGAATPEATPMS
jgi:hypothetical protein